MENLNQSNQTTAACALPLVKVSKSYKLIVPESVEQKIRHLCNRVSDVEWSGVLFYDYTGSFDDDLTIICKDIFVMDIGSTGYTEYDVNPDIASYMCDNPELLDCQLGLIHSHNSMPAFFSNTDVNTLRSEGCKRNHFVSLIVNNAGDYTAAITREIKSELTGTEIVTYNSFGDTEATEEYDYSDERTEIQWFNLDVTVDGARTNFDDIDNRLEEIKKSKRASVKSVNTVYPFPKAYKPAETFQPSFFEKDMVFDGNIGISEKTIKNLTLQLLTGSIVMSDNGKIDIDRWVSSMENTYNKRFENDEKAFSAWAEMMCEFIVFFPSREYKEWDENTYGAAVAAGIEEELKRFPRNKYIDILIETLEIWSKP